MAHSDSRVNCGTIEVQFDYNCATTDFIAVADQHGWIDFEKEQSLLNLITSNFDRVIVHNQGNSEGK